MITLIVRHLHVLPALIGKFSDAKKNGDVSVTCWGDGSAMREFLHVDDLAEACFTCMKYYDSPEPINIELVRCTIKQLAETIARTVGYDA